MYEYRCKVVKIIDGDTVDVDIDLGFGVWLHKERVRLYGINTPETRTRDLKEKQAGIVAKKRLQELIDDSGGKFRIQSHGIGKYGRCLGTLFIDDTNINVLLLEEGLAEKY